MCNILPILWINNFGLALRAAEVSITLVGDSNAVRPSPLWIPA
jgi:hypothetical protein